MNLVKVLKGILCGILYVSSFFLTAAVAFAFSDIAYCIVILSAVLTNVTIGLLMASTDHRYAFYKWLISLPAGIITYLVYRETDFLYYCLNKTYPDYGSISAGGGFALLLYIIFYLGSFVIAAVISFCITNYRRNNVGKP